MPVVDDDQIKDLLIKGAISAISVDTSVFDQKQLQLSSVTMQAMASFKDRPFEFLLSNTVAKEVLAHLVKHTEEAIQAARKSIGKSLNVFETKKPTREEILELISGGRTAEMAAHQRWEKFVKDTGCEILSDTDLVETATVFDAYFAGFAPFGSGRKKDEFPDALALNALERTASKRSTCILVVSKDGDWRAFCENSRRLFLVPEIERALNLVTDAPLGLRKAILCWMSEGRAGREEIRHGIAENVEQIEFTASAYPTHGDVDLFAWGGELKRIDWPNEMDIDIIEVDDSNVDGVLRVVLSLPVVLSISVPIEMSFSVWDSVDKESVDMGSNSVEVEEDMHQRVTITADVFDFGTEAEDIAFYQSELVDKYHEIELGEVSIFEPEDYWAGEEPP